MDDDLNLREIHAEKPFGLNHFEALVHERGGVNGDALAHLPIGMREGLFWRDLFELRDGSFAERASGGG